ncbi:hypothetical protein J132_04779 [Termitomyces sp. J132]|nr:hypothetical protein J132_04779 [Termitomyces sp. J132]
MFNAAHSTEWDVLTIQEPYLDRLGNTKASHHWRVVYPTDHRRGGSSCSRSVLLISSNIPTDAYTVLPIPSTDITAVCFTGEHGAVSIVNIYNVCKHNDLLTALDLYLTHSLPLT